MSPPLVVPSAERIDLPTMGMPGPVIRLVALATKCPTPNDLGLLRFARTCSLGAPALCIWSQI